MPTEILDPKNDFTFKLVFGQDKNKEILIHSFNDVLYHEHIGKIPELTFLERAQNS